MLVGSNLSGDFVHCSRNLRGQKWKSLGTVSRAWDSQGDSRDLVYEFTHAREWEMKKFCIIFLWWSSGNYGSNSSEHAIQAITRQLCTVMKKFEIQMTCCSFWKLPKYLLYACMVLRIRIIKWRRWTRYSMVLKFYVEVKLLLKKYLFRDKCNEEKLGSFEGSNTIHKTSGSQKKTLKGKGATEEHQKTAVIENGAMESGIQPPKVSAFPPDFSISEIKNKQWWYLMFTW